jgi:hypothetical protein
MESDPKAGEKGAAKVAPKHEKASSKLGKKFAPKPKKNGR